MLEPGPETASKSVDEEARVKIGREISPIYHVTKDDPPTLIIHGDKDALVPLQQSELIIAKFEGGRRAVRAGRQDRARRTAGPRLARRHAHDHRLVRQVFEVVVSGQWSVVSGQWSVVSGAKESTTVYFADRI